MQGYDFGSVAASPVSSDELAELHASVLFGDADEEALRQAGKVLADQVEQVLDVWYGFVGGNPHLLAAFAGPDGQPIPAYLEAVRARFGQWILDTCERPHDTGWLAWQHEIGMRHSRAKKNQTDRVEAAPVVPLRHLIALIYPISATIKPFLASGGHSEAEVEAMWQAWFKAVTLQVALWARAYCEPGDW